VIWDNLMGIVMCLLSPILHIIKLGRCCVVAYIAMLILVLQVCGNKSVTKPNVDSGHMPGDGVSGTLIRD